MIIEKIKKNVKKKLNPEQFSVNFFLVSHANCIPVCYLDNFISTYRKEKSDLKGKEKRRERGLGILLDFSRCC